MEGNVGSAIDAKAANRKRVKAQTKSGAKGPKMEDKVPCNISLSRRAIMALDNHAILWRGSSKGNRSAIVEWLIIEGLKDVRTSFHQGEPGQGPDQAAGPRIAG